ncbi:MAG: hypothetical protein MH204_11015, partial [Fimbriimonadaceae bacterium]|nr:hypothetical protein [Fimbriimonadaceae bacterium]
ADLMLMAIRARARPPVRLPRDRGDRPPSWARDMLRTLEPETAALDKLVAASARPGWDFRLDPDMASVVADSNLGGPLLELGRMLCRRAEARALSGDFRRGVSDLAAAQRLSRMDRGWGTLVHLLREVALRREVADTLTRLLDSAETSPADRAALGRIAANLGGPIDVERRMRGELYSLLALTRNLKLMPPEDRYGQQSRPTSVPEDRLVRDGVPGNQRQRSMTLGLLRDLTAIYHELERVESDVLGAVRDFEERTKRTQERPPQLSAIMSAILLPVTESAGRAVVELQAGERAVQTLFRLAAGEDGPIPEDPFTGEPMKVVSSASLVMVCSLGPNGKYDDGRSRMDLPRNAEDRSAYDICAGFRR